MIENERICTIWGDPHTAKVRQDHPLSPERVDSPRAGGEYEIASGGSVEAEIALLTPPEKARLTTWLIDQRSRGVDCPKVTAEIVESVRRKPPLPAHERAVRLLRFTATKSESIGTYTFINVDDPGVLAWSESSRPDEVDYLIDYLKSMGWIEGRGLLAGGGHFRITVNGYRQIAHQATNPDSSQAFVAMWFNESMDDIFDNGFEPAIEAAGYKAERIDRKPHLGKIDDQIIADIRRSRFVVADFTHGEKGARGSVYFEAGFAFGLNIPVIFTCRKDMLDELHFDTRQYPHIAWEEGKMDEFQTQLRNRIEALIGRGPNPIPTPPPQSPPA